MQKRDVAAAINYHESTKLAYINLANKPPLYKSYSGLPAIALPTAFSPPSTPTLAAVGTYEAAGGPQPTLNSLAQLLYYCAGVTRTANFRLAGEVHFRAAASAGGLYPVETYVVSRDIDGLAAGVYHFGPDTFQLTELRKGDYRSFLAAAAGGEPEVEGAPFTVVFTTVFWRSSWKYRTRGYRYCFWDNGTVAANLLAAAAAADLPTRLVNAFADHHVDDLLGIDGAGEASTCLVAVGSPDSPASAAGALETPETLDAIGGTSVITAPGEIEYPDIRAAHRATLLTDPQAAAQGKGSVERQTTPPEVPFISLEEPASDPAESSPLGATISERGSTRRFEHVPIPLAKMGAMLKNATQGIRADFLQGPRDSLQDLYLIVNSVEGLAPGAYYFSPERQGLYLLKEGDFRHEAGHLGFEQAIPHDASAVVFFLANLEEIIERFGNRGYRAAQLEAGIVGGKLYLAAHSLGLGATGLTFYDDEVTEFFSPHAAGKSAMFVVPLGVTAAVNRVRPFRSRIAVRLDAQSRGARQV